ncbi:MAG TPA: CAP domain-containing protein [Solirubrobacteraceae bacterium]|jgi:uncharacterized protein YkwD|nr:CAP domain-containing protein [Solirubrobacteraceae bacterium]
MARKSPDAKMNKLVAIAASLLLAGAAAASPGVAIASTGTAHAAKVTHHKVIARAKKAHKTTPAKPAHKVVKAKKTASRITRATQTPAPTGTSTSAADIAACADGSLVPTSANLDVVRAATLCLVNQQRALAGLAPLRENAALDAAAQAHSDDMVASNYFDHVTPTGTDVLSRVVAAGFATVASVLDLGENLAAGGGSLATPAATVTQWMNSAPHRANILDPTFQQTGIGVAPAVPAMLGIGTSGATYTQAFGTAS